MEYTIEQERLVYNLKKKLRHMIEDCSSTEAECVLKIANKNVLNCLEGLGFEDKSYLDLYMNK
jgi:hypothetical protein